jgi:hypothetical protein
MRESGDGARAVWSSTSVSGSSVVSKVGGEMSVRQTPPCTEEQSGRLVVALLPVENVVVGDKGDERSEVVKNNVS